MTLQSRWATTAGVLGLAVALGAGLYLVDQHGAPQSARRLYPDSLEAVQTLRIHRQDMPAVVLQRTDSNWRVPALGTAADPQRVAAVLRFLASPIHDAFPPQEPLREYGLAPPAARIEIDQGRPILLGARVQPGLRFARIGEEILLIADQPSGILELPAHGFAHRNPLGPDPIPIGFRLAGFTLELSGQRWQLQPDDPKVSADAIQSLVEIWRHAQAISVSVAGAEHDPAEANGFDSIQIRVQDGTPVELEVAREAKRVIFTRRDRRLRFHFDEALGRRLLGEALRGG